MKTIELFQWDLDKSIPAPYPEVHFASLGDEEALVVMAHDGKAAVPNVLLQEPKDIMVWFMEKGSVADSGHIRLITRPKPTDYVYTETEVVRVEKLVSDMKQLQSDMAKVKEDMGNLQVGSIPPATVETLGGIKVGQNLTITSDGTLNAPYAEKGEKGEKGDTGLQGVAGAKGDKGDTGAKGADGYTPQRGVDYWTEADKQEIQSYITQQLGVVENGSY